MPYLLGESVNLGVGQEGTRGTPVAPQDWIAGRTPTGVRPVVDKVLIQETRAVRTTSKGSEIIQQYVEGDLEFNVKNGSIGHFLKSLLGSVSSALVGGETVVYEHEFSLLLNDPQNPSLTLALSQPNGFQDYKYALCLVSSLELNTPVDDLVNATVEFIGADETTNANYSVAFSADDYLFRNHDVTIKIAADVAGLAAAQPLKVKEFSLSLNNSARTNQNIGELTPSDVLALLLEITGSITVDYTGETFHDIYVAGEYRAMEVTMVRDDITIGVLSNPSVTFILPKVSFETREPDRPIDDIVTEPLDFTAHYDDDEASAVSVVLINEVEDYNPVSGS